jgi:hypothetical protein
MTPVGKTVPREVFSTSRVAFGNSGAYHASFFRFDSFFKYYAQLKKRATKYGRN